MKPLLIVYALISGADATTTHVARIQGAREAWLPSQNVWVLDGIIAGHTAASAWGLVALNARHPRLAKIIGWSVVGVKVGVVAHNARELRQQSR